MSEHPHTAGAVRVERADGEILGTGFLVDGEHVLTCAHLFAEDDKGVGVRFFVEPERRLEVEVVNRVLDEREDLAVLRLLDERPEESRAVELGMFRLGERVHLLGFSTDVGEPVTGTTRLTDLRGWVPFEPDGARTVAPGASGSAVWSEERPVVVGMVVAREGLDMAYMIPTAALRSSWSELSLDGDRYRSMAPPPVGYVERREFGPILEHLTGGGGGATAITSTLALKGAGGFGKTLLAQALCADPAVRRAFPGGILWTTMGEDLREGDRVSRVRDLLRWWAGEEPPGFEGIDAATAGLRESLAGREVFLVVDDAWSAGDVKPFSGMPEGVAVLVTTRNSGILTAGTEPFAVDEMAPAEATAVLGAGIVGLDPEQVRALAARLGEWPLLLGLVNGQIRELIDREGVSASQALDEVEEALHEEGVEAFDRADETERNRAVGLTLNTSLERLAVEDRDRFEQLAIFPEDTEVPLTVIARLWKARLYRARKLCRRFRDLSLVRSFDGLTLRVHDVIRAVLRYRRRSDLDGLNRLLLERLLPPSGHWFDLDPLASYSWTHLSFHFQEAGRAGELRDLLLTPQWLIAKLNSTDISQLLQDFRQLTFKRTEPVGKLFEALRRCSHILSRDPNQLVTQLWKALLSHEDFEFFLQDARWSIKRTHFLLFKAHYNANYSNLIRVFETDGVGTLHAFKDGRVAACGIEGWVKIWSIATGELELSLAIDEPHLLTELANGDVVSGAGKSAFVWDRHSTRKVCSFHFCDDIIDMIASNDNLFVLLREKIVVCDLKSGAYDDFYYLVNCRKDYSLVILDDGRLAAYCPMSIEVVNLRFGNLESFCKVPDDIYCFVLRSDGKAVSITTTNVHQLVIWDPLCWEELEVLTDLNFHVFNMKTVEDSNYVLLVDRDQRSWLWNLSSDRPETIGHFVFPGTIDSVGFSNAIVATASYDGRLRLWKGFTGERVVKVEFPQSLLDPLIVSHDCVIAHIHGGPIRLWNVSSGIVRMIKGPTGGSRARLLMLPSYGLCSFQHGKGFIELEVDAGIVRDYICPDLSASEVRGIFPLSDLSVCVMSKNSFEIWNLKDQTVVSSLPRNNPTTNEDFSFWNLGGKVAISDGLGEIVLLILTGGHVEQYVTIKTSSKSFCAMSLLNDERLIAVDTRGFVHSWSLKGSEDEVKEEVILRVPASRETLVLQDGRIIVSLDKALEAWCLEKGRCIARIDMEHQVMRMSILKGLIIVGDSAGNILALEIVEGRSD